MELFKDQVLPAAARAPLKVLNGPIPARAAEIKAKAPDLKPKPAHNALELRPDAYGVAVPAKVEIGAVQDPQSRVGHLQQVPMLKRSRRPKQPTFIMKPKQEEKSLKEVPPCGVLGDLNPGILRRVRSREEVLSIIKASLSSGSAAAVGRKRLQEVSAPKCRNRKVNRQEPAAESQESDSLSLEGMFLKTEERTSAEAESSDKLEVCQSTIDQEFEAPLDNKAPARVWFKLLNQDVKGRLSALKRSRRRVRTALVAKDENIFVHWNASESFSGTGDPEVARRHYEMQMAKWKALFVNMDNTLGVEAENLERVYAQLQQFDSRSATTSCLCNFAFLQP